MRVEHVIVDDRLNAIFCAGCITTDELPRSILHDPERRLEFIELWSLDHIDCDKFKDAAKAKANRELRKEADRRKLLKRRIPA